MIRNSSSLLPRAMHEVLSRAIMVRGRRLHAPEKEMRQSVQGMMRNTSSALPSARALRRSSSASPVRVALPVNPNTSSASRPTSGAAHAASAPSKHLRPGHAFVLFSPFYI
jgi:hypothetical protein